MGDVPQVHGTIQPGFEKIKEAFEANFQEREELGACFAVYRDGKKVIDIWGGHIDEDGKDEWREDSIVNVFSATKGPMALAVAILADRGKIDYATSVTDYWPEFGANGKSSITVGQLMSHQGGVCGLRELITVENYYDWTFMCDSLAAMEPFWTPGDGSGYHAVTFGFLAGELVRRVDGRTPGQFIAEEICAPTGADFFCGTPESEFGRIAPIIMPQGAPPLGGPEMSEPAKAALANPPLKASVANTKAWRQAEIPAANGHTNARGLATIFAPFAIGGGALISKAGLEEATKERCRYMDRCLNMEMSWASGFIRNNSGGYGPNEPAFGHTGWGGAFGFADPVAGVSIGYAMNRMSPTLAGDMRGYSLVAAAYDCL
jgi:CubicO group peptidase (beta-lactamase class C family)